MSTNKTGWMKALASLAGLLMVLVPGKGQAESLAFDPGSLIIPMQANYQSACGVTSAYGLIWRILQSNQAGHFNASHPVTIYWVIGLKNSINRCVPSNKHTAPTTTPNRSAANWDDGCDLVIPDTGSPTSTQPVTLVDFSTVFPATGIYPTIDMTPENFSTVGRTSTGGGSNYAKPAYPKITGFNTAGGFNRIKYLGGPFVIAAADAQNVIEFLRAGELERSRRGMAPRHPRARRPASSEAARVRRRATISFAKVASAAPSSRRMAT